MTNGMIVNTASSNGIIDFRSFLATAQLSDYAMLHQQRGGRTDQGVELYPSNIRMTICNYTKQDANGRKVAGNSASAASCESTTSYVNLEPTIFYEWLEVCKASIGTQAVSVPADINATMVNVTHIGNALHGLLSGMVKAMSAKIKGNTSVDSESFSKDTGAALKTARDTFKTPLELPGTYAMPRGVDYNFVQDKVNIYKKGSDGFAPVSRLSVTRTTFRENGEESRYPWTLKITNGEAPVKEAAGGTCSFDGKAMRNKTDNYIMVSDRDMFRMMTMVTHYITAWENAMCISLIRDGERNRANERESYNNR